MGNAAYDLFVAGLGEEQRKTVLKLAQDACAAGETFPKVLPPVLKGHLNRVRAHAVHSSEKGRDVFRQLLKDDERVQAQRFYKDYTELSQEASLPLLLVLVAFFLSVVTLVARADIPAILLTVGWVAGGVFVGRKLYRMQTIEDQYICFCLLMGEG